METKQEYAVRQNIDLARQHGPGAFGDGSEDIADLTKSMPSLWHRGDLH